jgi:hypothetical protein
MTRARNSPVLYQYLRLALSVYQASRVKRHPNVGIELLPRMRVLGGWRPLIGTLD